MPYLTCHTSLRSIAPGAPRRRSACRAFQSISRGFLPVNDPLQRLTDPCFAPWEDALTQLPKYGVAAGQGELRQWLLSLPDFQTAVLLEPAASNGSGSGDSSSSGSGGGSEELWRAYLLLSFLAHGFMWCDEQPPPALLPAKLAAPWCAVAAALGMPPVLTYSTYNLYNWRRLDASQPVQLGNIVCLHNFLGGIDEEWFRLIHVTIEAQAAPAIAALKDGQRAAAEGDVEGVRHTLEAITAALVAMQATLARMGEKCDPYVYYQRVRLPMSGWRNNAALTEGLVYEGQFGGQPQQLYGETGAQSSILHALDSALGIQHDSCSWLKAYLMDMRRHMPPAHRAFVEELEAGHSLREATNAAPGSLKAAYNECVVELERFRSQHKAFAFNYIAKHSKREGEKGTGGSDFMPALAGYRDATSQSRLL